MRWVEIPKFGRTRGCEGSGCEGSGNRVRYDFCLGQMRGLADLAESHDDVNMGKTGAKS
jgi:hypothetical protein